MQVATAKFHKVIMNMNFRTFVCCVVESTLSYHLQWPIEGWTARIPTTKGNSYQLLSAEVLQESLAIAKTTARCAQYMGALKSFETRESSQTPPSTFPEICNGLLLRSILRMCIQNLKFVALSVPEIIGGTEKNWAVPVYAHAPVSPKFLIGFCSYGPSEYICQIWSS